MSNLGSRFTKYQGDAETLKRAEANIFIAINSIKSQYRFLINIINGLEPVAVNEPVFIGTDGKCIFYSPNEIIFIPGFSKSIKIEGHLLHIFLHGFLGHFCRGFASRDVDVLWLVMDLQVMMLSRILEGTLEPLYYDLMPYKELLDRALDSIGLSLYFEALKDEKLNADIRSLGAHIIAVDDHSIWAYPPVDDRKTSEPQGGGLGNAASLKVIGDECLKGSKGQEGKGGASKRNDGNDGTSKRDGINGDAGNNMVTCPDTRCERDKGHTVGYDQECTLREISERIRKSEGKMGWGTTSGSDTLMCKAGKSGLLKYSELFKDLGRLNEVCLEEDIIDPVLYSYGLEMYGDVPIIEPVDITEKIIINTAVIAIDTSGSCTDLIDRFWAETRRLFSQVSGQWEIGSIILLECDTQITDEQVISDIALIGDLPETYQFSGFGGTDFRPVFERIEEYEKHGDRVDLLVYFSDLMGDYPDAGPDYPVYFVADDESSIHITEGMRPKWVNCMVLDKVDQEGFL